VCGIRQDFALRTYDDCGILANSATIYCALSPPSEYIVDAAQLRDDLKGQFKGEFLLDDIARTLYSTDASLFEVKPLGIAVPCDEEDVRRLVRYARDRNLALIPRGAGTGVAGESLGRGLIVDLSVHFRSILEVGANTVRVQPGVVYRDLNVELAKHGRRFAPDTASGAVCTIGGMLATNASGSRACLHGYTRDHVEALRVVWDDGAADQIRSGTVAASSRESPRTTEISNALAELIRANRELITANRPRTSFNRCGYLLHDVSGTSGLDLPRLLVGSEGTLAVFTEATLRTIPLAGGVSAVLFAFMGLDSALRAAALARPEQPSACDLLDRRVLSLARGHSPELARLIPASAEAMLLVEFERDDPREAEAAVVALIDSVQRQHALAVFALPAHDETGIERLWRVREAALPGLHAIGRGARPLAFVEDIAVPPDDLPDFMTRVQAILKKAEVTASFVIHAAAGQVHTRPFLDLDDPGDTAKLWALADQVHGLALEMGGTVSTQHGTGIARTPWVEKQYGRLFPVFREVKRIFDPRGIFNPGKIVGPDPGAPAWPLRSAVGAQHAAGGSQHLVPANGVAPSDSPEPGQVAELARVEASPTHLLWRTDEMPAAIAACNGCGECRTEETGRRMCPIFRATRAEAAAPRAKANLLRSLLSNGNGSRRLAADEVREVADLCVNCKMCAHECPAHADIPKLMLEAKAANQAEHGLDRNSWVLARAAGFAAVGSNFAFTINTALSSRAFRWILEKVFGVSRHRRLPAFASRNFLKRARRKGWTKKKVRVRSPELPESPLKLGTRNSELGTDRVAYFIDVFANYNDPLIAEATVAVLHHHGVEVYVPPDQRSCGMAALAQGDLETAREQIGHNVRILAELVREGFTIVCSEPTAALMFRQDAASVVDDPDVQLVAEHTVELTAFLAELYNHGRLRTDFRPLDLALGHHVPCHLKALGFGIHGPDLLSLIPGLRVHTIDVSCSGMAGLYGLTAGNYETSLQAGAPMLRELARPRILFGSTECSACRMQMEQGSGKRTLHPVQYLALAYGLVPELTAVLRKPIKELVSS
jgi:FAD/FMN-containing dehydrogenase/Fe-S oxidoreductase